MIEVYKEIRKTKDIENENFTGVQAVAFAMKTFENLKKAGNLYITTDLLGGYMVTLMKMYIPNSIENIATEVFEEHKKDDEKSHR